MKKFVLMSTLLLGTMGAMAQQHDHSKMKKEEASKKEAYQCPMKCEKDKTYAKKGTCPKCTMELKLVKK